MPRRLHLRGADARQATRAAAVGLTLAMGVTACGGSDTGSSGGQAQGSSNALSAVQAAYEKTTGADTVKIAVTSKPQQGSKSPAAGRQKPQPVTGKASLSYKDDAIRTTISSGGNTSETRVIDNFRYQKVPKQQRKQVPGKKPWVKLNLTKIAKFQYGKQASEVTDNPPSDPAGLLMYLRSVKSATAKGTTTIDGTETTKYNTKVNLLKAAKKQGPQAAQQAKGLKKQLGTSTMSMQVWLDGENRVRRLKTTLPGAQPASPSTILVENFHDYSTSLEISPPADSKTANVTKQAIKRQKQQKKMMQQMQKRRQQRQQQQPSAPPASPSS